MWESLINADDAELKRMQDEAAAELAELNNKPSSQKQVVTISDDEVKRRKRVMDIWNL
jgi:hypothetical protein